MQTDETEDGLPLDDRPASGSVSAEEADTSANSTPRIDPQTGMELEEDELPILTP